MLSIKRKLVTSVISGCLFFTATEICFAQSNSFQLRNGDFEAPFVPSPGASATGTEPPYWHSFGSLTGPQASLARSGAQISQSTDTRNGIGYSCRINARSIIIAIANGNMTTGRINAGSMTASNAANHNFTDPNDSSFNEPWTSTPDSIRFWAKYTPNSATQWARMSAFIHDDYKFTDPIDGDTNSANYVVANAMLEWQRGDQSWIQYTIPFDYASYAHLGKSPKYIIITFTTNRVAGSGSGSDALYIDDIEMIYSACLADLKVNGVTIPGFEKELLTYGGPKLTGTPGSFAFPYQPEDISWTTEVNDVVSVVVQNVDGPGGDADGGYTSILITAEDSVTTKEYRIYYYAGLSDDNNISAWNYTMDGVNSISVPGFTSSTLNYSISFTDPEEVRIPQIREEDVVLSDPKAEIYRINQPTGVNSVGSVIVRSENYNLKTYTLTFSKVVSSNSKLATIKVGGVDIEDFDTDTLIYNYEITNCVTAIPAITWTTSSPWANVTYTPATTTSRTATILVRAENGDTTTYTVNLELKNNNAALTGYRVNTTNRNVFNDSTFIDTYAASFTSLPSLSVQASQQSCGASTVAVSTPFVWYPDTNYITVTAQDTITKQTYGSIIKNTNCYLATGNNNGLRFNYNGLVNQNSGINISTTNNNNTNTITTSVITLPAGPDVPAELVVYGLAAAANAAPPTVTIIQPKSRTDTAIVTLLAHDSVTSKTYRIPFRPTISTDATLSGITSDGQPLVGFVPATEHYTIIMPSNATVVPEIAATPNFQWLADSNIVITQATSLLDTAFITVTAENGTTIRTYSVDFELVEPEKDAYLMTLLYDNTVVPGFNPTIYDYTVDIPYSTATAPVLSALPTSATARVFFDQPTTLPYTGTALVLSEDMTVTKYYTVNFNLVKNTDSTLADIKVNGVSLEDFDPQKFSYTVELPYTELNAPIVSAMPTHPFAQVDITQIDTIMGTVTIVITSEDEENTATYTIAITRELSPVIDIETITYQYNSQTYTHNPVLNQTAIKIMLPMETEGNSSISSMVLSDNRAEYSIDEQPDAANNFTATIRVTAEDETEETYYIAFERIKSGNILLTGISYNGNPIPNFDPNTTSYSVILPFNNSQNPTVAATLDWKYTDMQIDQPSTPFGRATILVTSEDGQNSITYTILFQRKGNPALVALAYNLGGTSIPVPNFSASTLVYNIVLPIATTDIPVLEYVPEDNTCSVDTIQQTAPNGTSQLKFTTWNQDSSLTYTVNFTVELSQEALLADLLVDGVTIADFPNRLNYAMEVDYQYGISTLPVVTAIATQPDARVEITQIAAYPETAIITVYAGNTAITRTYTIAFSMEPGNNTYLSDLQIDEEPLWEFNKNVFFYEVKLPYGTIQLPEIDAIAEDSRSEVAITQALQIGDTAKIEIVALNGDIALYQVFFVLRKNDNAYAKNIFVNGEPLANFAYNNRNYAYKLPFDYSGIPFVAVELEDPNATYTIIPPPVITDTSGQMQIIVTAEDGESQFSYRINFSKDSVRTSIVSYDNEIDIYVYPNPSTDKIHFVISGSHQSNRLDLYTIEGKLIGNYILQEGTNTIPIEGLPKGMYFYKIFSDKAILGIGKFVKN